MKWLIVVVAFSLAMRPATALAHGDPIEHALERGAGPEAWVPLLGVVIALGLMVAVAILAVWRGVSGRGDLRYFWGMAQLLLLWLLLGYLQDVVAGVPGARWLLNAGYLVLPLALLAVWVFVLANFRPGIREVLRSNAYRALAVIATLVFLGAYLWSTNLVAPPEPDEMPAPGTPAFLVPFSAYGPLAIWPNLEFWIPGIKVFGAISLGTGMFVLTLGPLVGTSLAMLVYSLRQRFSCYRSGTVFGGSAVVALGTNFCCCCAPAAYPLLVAVLGTTTASSLAVWMVGSSSPLYDLTQVATLSLALMGLTLLSRQLRVPEP